MLYALLFNVLFIAGLFIYFKLQVNKKVKEEMKKIENQTTEEIKEIKKRTDIKVKEINEKHKKDKNLFQKPKKLSKTIIL